MNDDTRDRLTTAAAHPLQRRGLLIGAAGAAGAAALAIKTLPGAAPIAPVAVAAHAAVDPAGGYQVTSHVLRYYETARS
jgi:hypothetical protein